jgi:hypothetical protein
MGTIRERSSGNTQHLEAEHVVGRAPGCATRINERYVSAQHAIVRWTGTGWELRDLSSRNGTFLNGSRVSAGHEYTLAKGAKISFGKTLAEWELIDDGPACAMAVPVQGGDPTLADGDLLALPSQDHPEATIYRNTDGSWVLEQADDSITPITNLQLFEIHGRSFKFCCPENSRKTSLADSYLDNEVRQLQLIFSVSSDEEHVQLHASLGSTSLDLGSRSHNYLLLTLARRRLDDAAAGLPETSCGWLYLEDLAHDPSMSGSQLNIDVFRIRKQFAALHVVDAAQIIERRPRTRQLRIGTGRISIVRV